MDPLGEPPHITATTFLRVISLSIAFYDYVLTLPAEWRFYRSQRSWRLSPGCILFIAIRYSSVAVLLLSNIGYFGHFFTPEACRRYYMAPPVFKVIQAMVSQLILGIRTINISRRSPAVTWAVIVMYILISAGECFLNLWNRVPVQARYKNCAAGNASLTVWPFYILAMVYDIFTLGISTFYLTGFGPNNGKMARIVKIMLTDGLVYFVALTAVNIVNLILYRSTDSLSQSSGVSLGYALTWIMSQRLLIHLRDAAAAHNRSITTQVVVSRPLASAVSISRAMRSQFTETKDRNQLSSAFDIDWSLTSASAHEPASFALSRPRTKREGKREKKRETDKRGEESGRGATVREWEVERTKAGEGSADRDADAGALEAGCLRGERHKHRGRRHDSIDEEDEGEQQIELGVQVQVEEIVTVEYDADAYTRESYRQPRVMWKHDNGHASGVAGT